MSKRTPTMFLDTSKKPGDADCVRTAEDILAENERLKTEIERLRQPGNEAAMREALKYVLQFDATDEAAEEDGLTDAERIAEYADHIEECQKKARAALSAPRRNCEVGTPYEQTERWNSENPYPYELDDRQYLDAQEVLKWAQMPYEAAQKGGVE